VTPKLAGQIEAAVAVIPPAHRRAPTEGELVDSKEAAFTRLQDWAFTQGFALAIESGWKDRVLYQCTYHKNKTRNTCKLTEAECIRVETKVQYTGCKFSLYISKRKRLGDRWAIGSTCLDHNHVLNPDLFQYTPYISKRPGYVQAIDAASSYRGTISYSASAEILAKTGLELLQKEYYNLYRKEECKELTQQEELELLLQTLADKDLHPRVRSKYELDSKRNRTRQVIRDIFWITKEQIRLARRFVSGFMYETDTTVGRIVTTLS
jgi:hypothetical protein